MITEAFDDTVLEDYHYYPIAFRDHRPGVVHEGGVILERMNAAADAAADLERHYADTILPAAMARPGVRSGAFLAFRPEGQLMPTTASHRHVAIYRVDGVEALEAWRRSPPLDPAIVDPATFQITHWEPITPRMTEDAVAYTSAAALAAEERARRRMADHVHRGGREKLASPTE